MVWQGWFGTSRCGQGRRGKVWHIEVRFGVFWWGVLRQGGIGTPSKEAGGVGVVRRGTVLR